MQTVACGFERFAAVLQAPCTQTTSSQMALDTHAYTATTLVLGFEQAEHDGFERFAAALQAPRTLRASQALLKRVQLRLLAAPCPSPAAPAGDSRSGWAAGAAGAGSDIAGLLRRLFPHMPGAAAERYPARVFLSAYMLRAHPEATPKAFLGLLGFGRVTWRLWLKKVWVVVV